MSGDPNETYGAFLESISSCNCKSGTTVVAGILSVSSFIELMFGVASIAIVRTGVRGCPILVDEHHAVAISNAVDSTAPQNELSFGLFGEMLPNAGKLGGQTYGELWVIASVPAFGTLYN